MEAEREDKWFTEGSVYLTDVNLSSLNSLLTQPVQL